MSQSFPNRWPKCCSFNISPSSEYSEFISFRIDWFDLLAVQGILKSFLQPYSLKASILRCSAFLMVQLSHPYMTTRENIALTVWTFVSKVMSLLFITPSGFVIVFLPRSKCLVISWPAVTVSSDFGAQANKICHFFHPFSFYSMKWWDWMPWS